MAYNWAQLAFVEKWRKNAVRGRVVGMYRPEDKTYYDLRLFPGEGGVGQLPGPVDLHLVDAGDLVREKRMGLLDRAAVVIRIIASTPANTASRTSQSTPGAKRPRRWLEIGATVSGRVLQYDDGVLLLDIGFPVVVEFTADGEQNLFEEGQAVEFILSQTPQGFFVV